MRRIRLPASVLAVAAALGLGALLVAASGADPLAAYGAIVTGALGWQTLPNTLDWAVPLVGMTLAAAVPLRGGMVNLGGDGQLVQGNRLKEG
jgi:ABC-type uncharacterized transport system permease subunit